MNALRPWSGLTGHDRRSFLHDHVEKHIPDLSAHRTRLHDGTERSSWSGTCPACGRPTFLMFQSDDGRMLDPGCTVRDYANGPPCSRETVMAALGLTYPDLILYGDGTVTEADILDPELLE